MYFDDEFEQEKNTVATRNTIDILRFIIINRICCENTILIEDSFIKFSKT